ncbi:hypothetical protein [Mesorhizobium sp. M0496]|uniref:hypothetical protein n=1 Tax=Mesorhizobium sp. M0496 TaxID=2956952 RepID=UPI00333D6F91
MKPKEHRLLHAACRATAISDPALQQNQGETSDQSAKSLEKEISSFLKAVRQDRESVYKSSEGMLQPLMLLYDLALLQVCDMSNFGFENVDHRRRVIWPNLALPRRPRPNGVFYILTANLAHSMQAFRLLILHGFESQARASFRNVIEVIDLMTMVLASEATYREYIKSFEDDKVSYRHWKSHLSPAVIRASISKLEADNPIALPIDLTTEEIRKGTYTWLSNFTHVNYVAHVVAAHPLRFDGTSRRLAMLGGVGEMSKSTLAHVLVNLWISLLRIEHLLWEKHGWGRFRGDRSRHWFRYRCRAMDDLFRSYLPTFWEELSSADL